MLLRSRCIRPLQRHIYAPTIRMQYSAPATPNTSPPHSNGSSGSIHWYYERAIGTLTFAVVTTMFLAPTPIPFLDQAASVILPVHMHLGMDAIITDYLPKRKFPRIYPVVKVISFALTLITFYGIAEFNSENIGLTALIQKLWHAEKYAEKRVESK